MEGLGQGTRTRPPTGAQISFDLSGEKTGCELRLSEIQSLTIRFAGKGEKILLITGRLGLTGAQLKLKPQSFVISQKKSTHTWKFVQKLHNKAHLHLQKHASSTHRDTA